VCFVNTSLGVQPWVIWSYGSQTRIKIKSEKVNLANFCLNNRRSLPDINVCGCILCMQTKFQVKISYGDWYTVKRISSPTPLQCYGIGASQPPYAAPSIYPQLEVVLQTIFKRVLTQKLYSKTYFKHNRDTF
jgi:hypothetical protein